MEWTGKQQIWILLQSVVLGVALGLVLEVVTGFAQRKGKKHWLWTDVLFGPFAALVTFFGALLLADGQLHPVLFGGILCGMAIVHFTIGIWMKRAIFRICRFSRYIWRLIIDAVMVIKRFCDDQISRLFKNIAQFAQKGDKNRKLSYFFQKKT